MLLKDVRPSPGVPDAARAHHRIDPFWDGMWSAGSQSSWISADSARARQRVRAARIPSEWDMDADHAWAMLTGDNLRAVILSMLGATMAWRTLNAHQLAAFAGYPPLAHRSLLTRAAFAAGVFDVGVPASAMINASTAGPATSFRMSKTRVLERDLLPTLTFPERVVVTAGQNVSTGGQFDRHNMLTAELALRVAEMCDVGAVLGETLSSADQLIGTGLGRSRLEKDNRSADATIVRGDGLRIVVEITASPTPGLRKKIHRWAETLSKTSLENSGLVVLFVAAPPPDRAQGRRMAAELRKVMADVLRDYPGMPGRRPGDRIYLAEWSQWFPGPGEVDESFLPLRAELAPYDIGSTWRQVELLNPFDLPFVAANPDLMTAVLRGAATLGQSPPWLRTNPYELWPLAAAATGLPGPVVPPGKNKQGRHGGPLGAARGAARPARPPAALTPRPHSSIAPVRTLVRAPAGE